MPAGMDNGRGMMGYGQGQMYGSGYGSGRMNGYGVTLDEEALALRNNLFQKQAELNALLAAPEVDASKAKALQGEIGDLRTKLHQKMLAAELEYRKSNPNYRAYGRGYGRGYGPGYCWR